MTLVNLAQVLQPALAQGYAVGGLVTLGWEDMCAYVAAAEAENCPVILQAGPSCRAHTPLPVLGKMFRHLAEASSVPVVAHLDHGYNFEDCKIALDSGFTSVMFDGSRKSLQQNIDETAVIAEMAHAAGISCEGEIGFVGYSGGENSSGTDPEEAAKFACDSGVDAMAISVGNVHLQRDKEGGLDLDRIAQIQALTTVPLVIHGGSGVPVVQRKDVATRTSVCKFNIGTELREEFVKTLRKVVNSASASASDDELYDRVQILRDTIGPVQEAAQRILRAFGAPPQR